VLPRSLLYLDTSAALKRIKLEAESPALEAYVSGQMALGCIPVSSELIRTELARAMSPGGSTAAQQVALLLEGLEQIPVTRAILDQAGALLPGHRLRSLEAIHLASALGLGAELSVLVSYDGRMLELARQLGIVTANPA
jgi:predicted nucleic acid-binding protein